MYVHTPIFVQGVVSSEHAGRGAGVWLAGLHWFGIWVWVWVGVFVVSVGIVSMLLVITM